MLENIGIEKLGRRTLSILRTSETGMSKRKK